MIKRKLTFYFSLICFSLRKKTENDKMEVDFCFFVYLFQFKQKEKTIKRKLPFCFSFICFSSCAKNRKRLNGS